MVPLSYLSGELLVEEELGSPEGSDVGGSWREACEKGSHSFGLDDIFHAVQGAAVRHQV